MKRWGGSWLVGWLDGDSFFFADASQIKDFRFFFPGFLLFSLKVLGDFSRFLFALKYWNRIQKGSKGNSQLEGVLLLVQS